MNFVTKLNQSGRVNCQYLLFSTDEDLSNYTGSIPLSYVKKAVDDKSVVMMGDGSRKFSYYNGCNSVQKALGLTKSVELLETKQHMPEAFFQMLTFESLDNPDMFDIHPVSARECMKAKIRNYLGKVFEKEENKRRIELMKDKGVKRCVMDGDINPNQMRYMMQAEELFNEESDKDRRLAKELPGGNGVGFTNMQTGKIVKVYSYKGIGNVDTENENDISCKLYKENNDDVVLFDSEMERDSIKKKHYYIYSTKPSYGKSKFLKVILKRLNASSINDVKNWNKVSPHAQFIVMDEYGPNNSLSFENLKLLTSGNPTLFEGNCKTYGNNFSPREDVQIIIMSNKHLFQCVPSVSVYDAKLKVKTFPVEYARQLLERFHIIKLDDDTETDEECAAKLLSIDREHYDDSVNNKSALDEFKKEHKTIHDRFEKAMIHRYSERDGLLECENSEKIDKHINNLVWYTNYKARIKNVKPTFGKHNVDSDKLEEDDEAQNETEKPNSDNDNVDSDRLKEDDNPQNENDNLDNDKMEYDDNPHNGNDKPNPDNENVDSNKMEDDDMAQNENVDSDKMEYDDNPHKEHDIVDSDKMEDDDKAQQENDSEWEFNRIDRFFREASDDEIFNLKFE